MSGGGYAAGGGYSWPASRGARGGRGRQSGGRGGQRPDPYGGRGGGGGGGYGDTSGGGSQPRSQRGGSGGGGGYSNGRYDKSLDKTQDLPDLHALVVSTHRNPHHDMIPRACL